MSRRPLASTRDRVGARDGARRRATSAPRKGARARETTVAVRVVAPVRRRRVRAVRIALGAVALVVVIVVGGRWVLHLSFLRVQHLSVTGEVHETASQIESVTRLDTHPAMIDVTQGALLRDLRVYPWISSISLIKRWPNSIDLAIHEVRAVAVAYDARHVLRYVSATGRELTRAPLSANLPTLVRSPATAAPASWPFDGAGSSAALVASELPAAFSAQVRQIIVDAQGNVTLQLTTPLRFVLGPPSNLNAKFVAVASAIAHGSFVAGDVVDVTTPSELSVTGPSSS